MVKFVFVMNGLVNRLTLFFRKKKANLVYSFSESLVCEPDRVQKLISFCRVEVNMVRLLLPQSPRQQPIEVSF